MGSRDFWTSEEFEAEALRKAESGLAKTETTPGLLTKEEAAKRCLHCACSDEGKKAAEAIAKSYVFVDGFEQESAYIDICKAVAEGEARGEARALAAVCDMLRRREEAELEAAQAWADHCEVDLDDVDPSEHPGVVLASAYESARKEIERGEHTKVAELAVSKADGRKVGG